MINVQSWMQEAVTLLKKQFGSRLLFVGLQGSHRRGEAREDSDIDILTILEQINISDLAVYREILRTLPEGEKAGGFTCGKEELLAWPAFEIFQFSKDTDAYYGDLQPLLPPVTRKDVIEGARAGVSNLHHYATYLYISTNPNDVNAELKSLYKNFFFSMQLVEYLRHGSYTHSKQELLSILTGDEAELLRLSMDSILLEEKINAGPDFPFQLLLKWTGNTLQELAKQSVLAGQKDAAC